MAEETGWSGTAELSLVATAGNAESTSLGFKSALEHAWERSKLILRAEGVRLESTSDRFAVGTLDRFEVRTPESETTAESYKLEGRYERSLGERLTGHVGLSWDRNRFAGIDSRSSFQVGVGHIWRDSETFKFRTDYGVTVTRQEDVDGTEETFPGLRLASSLSKTFGKGATFEHTVVVDENLDDTEDLRIDMVGSIAVSLTERLALKASLQLLYDNQPSLADITLFDRDLMPTGDLVAVELDELDSILTTALVVNF
ncbi:MAG: DUF481 domain-containing protein [Acidobacteriota bacterium]